MYFIATLVFLVGISLSSARPADPKQEFQSELNKAVKPLQADVRAMAENANTAAKDLTRAVGESTADLLKAGEEFLTPVESKDRANIVSTLGQRIANLGRAVQQNTKSLLQRAVTDIKPLQANERSAFVNLRDAAQLFENKYLTSDGQELLKLGVNLLNI